MSRPLRALNALALAAALFGCAGGPLSGDLPGETDSGAIIGEVAGARERARIHTELAGSYYLAGARERARIHTELAGSYYQRGNLGVALAEARTAIAADSSYAPAYNVLGLVYSDLRENGEAEGAFERSLRLNPNDPDANHNYAWFLCENKREEEAIRYFLLAIRHPLYATPQKSYAMAALWLALRIERRLGDSSAVTGYANQLRRRFPGSKEYQELQKGSFE